MGRPLLAVGLLAACGTARAGARPRPPQCEPGEEVVVFCRPAGINASAQGHARVAASSGCLRALRARPSERPPGQWLYEGPADRGDVGGGAGAQDSSAGGTARANVFVAEHPVVSWAARAVRSSCLAEERSRRLAQSCMDQDGAPVITDPAGGVTWAPCSKVQWLCGLGINVEQYCPATCGLCTSSPAEHFWGRVRQFQSIDNYATIQQGAMNTKSRLRDEQWVQQNEVGFLAEYLRQRLPLTSGQGLCHGTRAGREQRWFMEALPGFDVWGTEISAMGGEFPNTISPWDFHDVPPGWEGQADFVYSNAIDHSYDPPLAIRSWMSTLAEEGALILDLAFSPGELVWQDVPMSDPYQASMAQLQRLILLTGPYEICDILRTESRTYLVASHEGRGACRPIVRS